MKTNSNSKADLVIKTDTDTETDLSMIQDTNSKTVMYVTTDNETLNNLDGMFDSVKEEKLDDETMERIYSKVSSYEKNAALDPDDHFERTSSEPCYHFEKISSRPAQKDRQHFHKKLVSILAMAACGAIIVSSAYMYETFLYKNANIFPVVTDAPGVNTMSESGAKPSAVTAKPAPSTEDISADGIRLTPVIDATDKISDNHEKLTISSDTLADRFGYYGLRFFDAEGETYICLYENGHLFKYDDNGFSDTGVRSFETLLFASDAYEGCSYIPYVPPACAGDFNESGLIRINIKTQEIEKYINSPMHVNSVTVIGSKVYYSEYDGSAYPKGKRKHYYLKCADLKTGEITTLISDAPYSILKLSYYNDSLYFITESDNNDSSVTETDRDYNLCRMDSDMVLHSFSVKNLNDYVVADGQIYLCCIDHIHEPDTGKSLSSIYHVYKYDTDGNELSEIRSVIEHSEWSAGTVLESHHLFTGGTKNYLTIYDEKLVEYDKAGIYLRNLEDDTFERIIELDRNKWSGIDEISSTVYDGKLFVAIGYSTIYKYDGKDVKTYELST